MPLCHPRENGELLNKKRPFSGQERNPRLPEHIKIRKSVAAFALAICPQIVIAQGLGTRNLAIYRDFCQDEAT